MRRLLHISDLHFGKTDHNVTEALLAEAAKLNPDLIVISGDLTQRARPSQFAEAADFLGRLPCRYLAVPGNHDIPLYHLPMRFFQPLRGYRRYIESQAEPVFEDREIIVAGLNTATRWKWVEGRLRQQQIRRVTGLLRGAPSTSFKVVVMHHPPEPELSRIDLILGERPDLVLSGHLHKNTAERHASGTVFVAAGTATSTRTRGESNTFNVIDLEGPCGLDSGTIKIEVHAWGEGGFDRLSTQSFSVKRAE